MPLFIFAHFGHHVIGAMIRPLMPMIRTDLGISYEQVGWIMSAFAITNGISQLPAGWLADRIGTRLIILVSISGVALAGFFIGFTSSFGMLVVLLIVSALLGGGYHPASAAALSASVPEEYRGRALGIHFVGGSSTFWIMPLIAALIANAWGWRSPFLVMAIPTMIFGIVIFILIGRYNQRIEGQKARGEISSEVSKGPETVRWGELIPFVALTVLTGTLLMSSASYLSLIAVDNLGLTESNAAMLMSVQPFVGAVAAPLGGYLADRFGNLKVMVVISILAAPLIYTLGLASNVAILVVIMVGIGLVSTARMPTSESYIFSNAPQRHRATVLGVYYFSGTGVSGVLTPFVGRLIDKYKFQLTYTYTSIVTAVVVGVCCLFLWIDRQRKRAEITY
ncbi:MFS transporter [Chloroflexota bacterium]